MKKLFLIFIFFPLTLICKSQDRFPFEWNGKTLIDSLKSKGVTSIISFKEFHLGAKYLFKSPELICESDELYYDLSIIWQEDNSTKIKKFNNCYEFSLTQSDSLTLFKFLSQNAEKLRLQKQDIKNKEKLNKHYQVASHSGQIRIEVINNSKSEIYEIDDYIVENNKKIYGDFKRTKLFEFISLIKKTNKVEAQKIK